MGKQKVELKGKKFSKFGKRVAWLSNAGLVFSALSAVSELKTWQDVVLFFTAKFEQLVSIFSFIGRLIDWILIPYHWITNLVFGYLPIDIPETWHDPVVIGIFIVGYPLIELLYVITEASRKLTVQRIEKLKKIAHIIPREDQYEEAADTLHKLITEADEFFIGLMVGPPAYYISALRGKDESLINQRREEFKDYLKEDFIKQYYLPDLSSKQNLKKTRIRALFAVILTVLITIDYAYAGLDFSFLGILLRSIAAMLAFSIIPLVIIIPIFLFTKLFSWSFEQLVRLLLPEEKAEALIGKVAKKVLVTFMGEAMPQTWQYNEEKEVEDRNREFNKLVKQLESKYNKLSVYRSPFKKNNFFSRDEKEPEIVYAIYMLKKSDEEPIILRTAIYFEKKRSLVLLQPGYHPIHFGVPVVDNFHKSLLKDKAFRLMWVKKGDKDFMYHQLELIIK